MMRHVGEQARGLEGERRMRGWRGDLYREGKGGERSGEREQS